MKVITENSKLETVLINVSEEELAGIAVSILGENLTTKDFIASVNEGILDLSSRWFRLSDQWLRFVDSKTKEDIEIWVIL